MDAWEVLIQAGCPMHEPAIIASNVFPDFIYGERQMMVYL